MTGQPLHLQCQSHAGKHIITDLSATNTIEDLRKQITVQTGISSSRMKILWGYPRRPLDLGDGSASLGSVGVRNGDTFYIEEEPHTTTSVGPSLGGDGFYVPGILVRRKIPADNSCLFNSIAFAVSGGNYDSESARTLRRIIADALSADLVTFNAAILGQPNPDYCRWILGDKAWGGAIEIAILSKHFGIEIDVIDTQHATINRFGEDESFTQRILLIYDGIHYEPMVLEPITGDGVEVRNTMAFQTNFPVDTDEGDIILGMALEVARDAQRNQRHVSSRNYRLQCYDCRQPLHGTEAAEQHARETGHVNFGEIGTTASHSEMPG